MLENFKKNKLYIFMTLFMITPLLTTLCNLINIQNYLAWFFPNFIMFYVSLKIILLNIKSIKRKEFMLLAIFFAILLISCLTSKYPFEAFFGSEYRLEGFITYLSYLGFFYCGTKLINEDKNKKIIKLMIIVGTIISILCITKLDIIYQLFKLSKENYYFYVGPFAHFNHFGYYLLIVNICSVFMYLYNNKKTIYFVINLILSFTLVINDTFGVYIAYVFLLIMLTVYHIIKKQKVKEILLIIFSFILISCVASRDGFNVVYRNLSGLLNDTNQVISSDNKEEIYSIGTNRGELWVNGVMMIVDKPLIGYGLENTKYEYFNRGVMQSKPHNLILELSLNSGIPSMIIYFVLIFLIVSKEIKKIRNIKPFYLMSLLIVISYLASSMFGNSTFYVSPYFYIFLGVISQGYYKETKHEV